jgi:galactonate dehydratase
MRIKAIETYIAGNPWKNWLFAKVITDEGIHGIGEGTLNYSRGPSKPRSTS